MVCRKGGVLPANMSPRANTYRAVRHDGVLAAAATWAEQGVGEDELDTRHLKAALAVPGAVLFHANPASAEETWLSARWFGRGNAVWVSQGRFLRLLATHCLPRSLAAAAWGAVKHRSLFFACFKLLFDAAVFTGPLCQGRFRGLKAR